MAQLENGPAAGRTVTITARPNDHYRSGATIRVEHLASDPEIVRVNGDRYGIFRLGAILPLLGGAILSLLLCAFGLMGSVVSRDSRPPPSA